MLQLLLKLHGTDETRRVSVEESANLDDVLSLASQSFSPLRLQPKLECAVPGSNAAISIGNDEGLAEAFERFISAKARLTMHGHDDDCVFVLAVFSETSEPVKGDDGSEWQMVGLSLEDIAGAHQGPQECPLPLNALNDKKQQELSCPPHNDAPIDNKLQQDSSDELLFWVNGVEQRVRNPNPSVTLVEYLHSIGLTGTKVGCGEGGCGCCTVSLQAAKKTGGGTDTVAINSCLRLLCAVDGCSITTTEGIGSQKKGFHPIQEAIADGNGTQCGYCTPGWVMSMYSLMENSGDAPGIKDIEEAFDGNLCRCTGYRSILDSMKSFAAAPRTTEGAAKQTSRTDPAAIPNIEDCVPHPCRKHRRGPLPLADVTTYQKQPLRPLHFVDPETGSEWFRPSSLTDLVHLRQKLSSTSANKGGHAKVRLVCGNTAMGVEKYYGGEKPEDVYQWDPSVTMDSAQHHEGTTGGVTIDIKDIPELHGIKSGALGISAGAAVTLSALAEALDASSAAVAAAAARESGQGGLLPPRAALARHIRRIANVQVRNCASWAGNLMLARSRPSFPSDVAVILMAAKATLQYIDLGGAMRSDVSVEDFLLSSDSCDGAVLVSVHIPLPSGAPSGEGEDSGAEGERGASQKLFATFKTSARHVNAAAIVNGAFNLDIERDSGRVSDATVVFNGLAPRVVRARCVETALAGSELNQDALDAAVAALEDDVAAAGGPSPDPHHSPEYRLALARSYIYKAFLQAQDDLPKSLRSALIPFVAAEDRPVSTGTQVYPEGDPSLLPVSKAVPKLTGRAQASGEASYTSTMPSPAGLLHGCLVFSTSAAARLLVLDPSPALERPGVVDFVGAADIPGLNALKNPSEPLFFAAGQTIPAVGVPLGIVVARSMREARAAAKAVRQVYDDPSKARSALLCEGGRPVASLEEARRRGEGGVAREEVSRGLRELVAQGEHVKRGLDGETLCGEEPLLLMRGDPGAFIERKRRDAEGAANGGGGGTVSSSFTTGAQKHFYMETQASVAIPQEDDCLELWSSTQSPHSTQETVAAVLGVAQHSVTVKVKRVGGGFGGKLNRGFWIAAACSVAAVKLGVPVRGQNERLDDLVMTGGREPMVANYSAAFSEDGTIEALDMELSMDMGWLAGCSAGSLAMAVSFSDNSYYAEHYKCQGVPYTTNLCANTAMRAPGVVQSILSHEVVMEHVAKILNLPMEVVQERNFYKPGQQTPAGITIGSSTHNWTVPEMWESLKQKVSFEDKKAAVERFNRSNRWRKRGVAMTPVRYGIGTGGFTSGALVNIYKDGSVLVSHGGCEIGQGINTKAAQVAAHTLGVDLTSVKISDTDTSKVPYNEVTGGSMTSETTAKSVEDACLTLVAMLSPYVDAASSFKEAAQAAIKDGVVLSAAGCWKNPVKGDEYSTCGVACTEVEVDALSGEVQILSTDILMDLGTALNPAIDLGQLEGGFIKALGYILTEEVLFDEGGQPLSLGTWYYKVPSAFDIPLKLNVELLNRPNPCGVFKSKASAEPPMSLVASVFFAVKNAIYAARSHSLETGWFELRTPLTVEQIQSACLVDPSQFVLE